MEKLLAKFNKSRDADGHKFEFEAQIGKDATKIDYNNVIKWLLLAGFEFENKNSVGTDILRIVISEPGHSVRIELTGIGPIQHYCRTQQLVNPKFEKKKKDREEDTFAIKDYWTKLSLSEEITIPEEEGLIDGKKSFRFMNRVRLLHKNYPFVYDCSIVRTSDSLESLFTVDTKYEVEVEFERGVEKKHIQQAITFALRGFQRSNYPISQSEKTQVLGAYIALTKAGDDVGRALSIAPKSITLQKENLYGEQGIFTDFCVTEKADGERKLLFITHDKIYFLVSKQAGLTVEFTGATIKEFNNTLLDGEHVTQDKHKKNTNLYLAFDAYFKKKDLRTYPFRYTNAAKLKEYNELRKTVGKEDPSVKELKKTVLFNVRETILKKVVEDIASTASLPFILVAKNFLQCTPSNCKQLLEKDDYPYHTDGVIFTPNSYGVGMTAPDQPVQNKSEVWNLSFKWKPAEENTIDFLVQFDDKELHKMSGTSYKQVELYVGFNPKYDIDTNPSISILQGYEVEVPNKSGKILFKPGGDDSSHISHTYSKDNVITTETNEIIETGMIVEFRYDKTRPEFEKWVPLRIRWDKMRDRKPNGFNVASSNWSTIQEPITEQMLTEPPEMTQYYASKDKTKERTGLQFFHSDVKRQLLSVINPKDIVIDFAIGLGGDLAKMSAASFILGVDIDENNIMNKQDGVCKRYLDLWRSKHNPFKTRGVFIQGDSSMRIKTGEGIARIQDKAIVRSIFGVDPKRVLGKGVDVHYDKAKHGFNVASMQFAVHYMFSGIASLTNFLRNLAECTAMNGYFVGTCYDGQRVFDILEKTPIYEIKDVCTITKKYKQRDVFVNESCLGYTINVNQTIIGQSHDEWLVFFPYFKQMLEQYGFDEVEIVDFETLYAQMPPKKEMTSEEKALSFLNKTFKFQKRREVLLSVKLDKITIA